MDGCVSWIERGGEGSEEGRKKKDGRWDVFGRNPFSRTELRGGNNNKSHPWGGLYVAGTDGGSDEEGV